MGESVPVVVELEFVEAMGTLAALRAVIDSAPADAVPVKLQSAADKIAQASRGQSSEPCADTPPSAATNQERH